MTAALILDGRRPLANLARAAGGQLRIRRSVLLASGGWLGTAHCRVIAQLEDATGPTRCSGVRVVSYPPPAVPAALGQLTHVDELALAGAGLAAQADARSGRPQLWLFVASCQVLWSQGQPVGECGGLS